MNTQKLAAEMKPAIEYAIDAHTQHPKTPDNSVRFFDRITPYAVHPIWCAMTLLTETQLPFEIRHIGYQALLWHDILEDTQVTLPENTEAEVRKLVEEMTFESLSAEREQIWERSDTAKLLKLYDKVSNLLDASWMSPVKRGQYVAYTLELTAFVENKYGELNIVKLAQAMCA